MIREATLEDIPEMHIVRMSVKENVLNNQLLVTNDDYTRYLTTHGKGWVCELDNEIAGFAIVDTSDNNIWALFVHPSHEKKGIGKKLQETMLGWFFTNSEQDLWLGTAPNTRAEKFYTQSGWQNLGPRDNGEVKFEMTYQNWMKHHTDTTLSFPVMRTERLILRQLSIGDENEIFTLRSDEESLKYLDIPKALSIDDAREFIHKINHGPAYYWALALIANNRLIGTICLWNFSEDRLKADIGYQLLPEFQGKGYMQEAMRKIIDYGFGNLKLDSILAELTPRNLKSVRILERNNFTKEGSAVDNSDSVYYTLERKKYENLF